METHQRVDQDGVFQSSNSACIQRVQIEHLNALQRSKDLQPVQTSRLVDICGDLTGLRALTKQSGHRSTRAADSREGECSVSCRGRLCSAKGRTRYRAEENRVHSV